MPSQGVVLDPNVRLSCIAYPGSVPGKLIAAWRHDALEVVQYHYILDEVRRVLPRLAHRHGFLEEGELADATDLPILTTLVAAQRIGLAYAVVSGDKALLSLREVIPSAPLRSSGHRTVVFERERASQGSRRLDMVACIGGKWHVRQKVAFSRR